MLIRAFVIAAVAVSVDIGKLTSSYGVGLAARNSTQIKEKQAICGSQHRCCKLGHRAARQAYTCRFEAFIQALEQQRSYSHRLLGHGRTPDRMVAVKAYKRASRFMKRLGRCRSSLYKRCFQSCCETKSNNMKKSANGKRRQKVPVRKFKNAKIVHPRKRKVPLNSANLKKKP